MAEFAETLLEQCREEDAGLLYLTRRQSPARPCARDGISVVSFDALGQLLAFLGNDLFDVVVAVAMFRLAFGLFATLSVDTDKLISVIHERTSCYSLRGRRRKGLMFWWIVISLHRFCNGRPMRWR